MMFSALVLVAAWLSPEAAGAVAGSTPSAQVQPKEEKKICRRIDASESRLAAKRVCKTAAEWRRDQDSSSDSTGRSTRGS